MSRAQNDEWVDEMLRRMANQTISPTDADLATARSALDAAIRSDRSRRSAPTRLRLVVAVGIGAIMMAVAGVVLLARPAPLEAALAEYAAVVLQSEPLEPVEGRFVLQQGRTTQLNIVDGSELPGVGVETLAYLIIETRDTWVGADGVVEIARTPIDVVFFSDDAAAAYALAGLAERDGIGVTATARQERSPYDLPSTDDELVAALRDEIRRGGSGLPEGVQLYARLASLLQDPVAPREVRAGAAQALNAVAGIELVDHDSSRIVVAIEYTDVGRVRRSLELDLATAQLLADTTELLDDLDDLGVPAGTVISQHRYQPLVGTPAGPSNG